MVEKKATRRSRRARRRERAEGLTESAKVEDESEEDESEEDESEEDESEEDESEEDESEEDESPKPNRAQRRAERARRRRGVREVEEAREAIRDRNRDARTRAAKRRREKRRGGTAEEEVAVGLDATEMVDDVLARASFKTTRWVRENSFLVQAVLVLSFVGLCGWTVYRYFTSRARDQRSDVLFAAVERQTGHVGEAVQSLNPEGELLDPRPTYQTAEERLVDAEQAYREALAAGGKTRPTTVLAQLGLATVLLQAGKYDEALQAFDAVKVSQLAKTDDQVRGRALEGTGLTLEAKGDTKAALATYQELENAGIPRFSKLALYHRARLAVKQGDTTLAKELLGQLQEKVGTPENPLDPGYTAAAMMELQMAVDPAAANNPLQALKQLEQLQRNAQEAANALRKTGLEQLPLQLDLKPKAPSSATPPAPSAGAPPRPAPAPPASAGSR